MHLVSGKSPARSLLGEMMMIRHVMMIKFRKSAPQEKAGNFLTKVKKLSHLNREVHG